MADDLGSLYTDRQLIDMERKLSRLYTQAGKDIEKKLADFTAKMAAKEKVFAQQVKDGKMTQEAFDDWKAGVVFRGKQWTDKMAQISAVLADTNAVATNILRNKEIGVFVMNGNYAAYTFEHGFGVSFGFDLYDEKTVVRLLADDPNILPFKKLDKKKDIRWNFKNIRTQITQGIVQGESIPQIAKRLATVVPNRNEKQMVLHARTAMTSAQNGGRQERYKEAEDLGIQFKKVWLATLDGRTRDTHADLDGQAVKPNESFKVAGYTIRFPGDPWARPELVYNCRCTLVTELDDYPSNFDRRAYEIPSEDEEIEPYRVSHIIKNMSYREWEKCKETMAALDRAFTPVKLVGGKYDPEVNDAIENYFLPQATRDKLSEIERLETYSDFKQYLSDQYGITLDTGLESLKTVRADDVIPAVKEQCGKIVTAVDAYRETFGADALSKLKKVVLYDQDLDVRAAYFFNRVGENDPLAGEIHFRQWGDDGRTIFHELAHAFQDSHAGRGEDAVTFSESVIKALDASDLKAYTGAPEAVYAAEQFADALGFGFGRGTKRGLDFIEKLERLLKTGG